MKAPKYEKFDEKKLRKTQDENVDLFSMTNTLGLGDMFIDILTYALEDNKQKVQGMEIRGKKITAHSFYLKYRADLKKFFKENNIINPNKLLKPLNLSKDKIVEDFTKIKEQSTEISSENIFSYIIDKYPQRDVKNYDKELLLTGLNTHKIVNAMKVFHSVYEKTPSIEDPIMKRFNIIYLYVVLFETLRELYKPIYLKLVGNNKYTIRKQVNYFLNSHPQLSKCWDYDLRNDASHIIYDQRLKYSNDKLERYNLNLMLQIIAYSYVCIDSFQQMCKVTSKTAKQFDKSTS